MRERALSSGLVWLIVVALSGLAPVSASASPPAWSAPTRIVPTSSATVNGVSCPSRTLCVAVDSNGGAAISLDPAAGSPTWTSAAIDPGHAVDAISCPSSSLCVTVDNHGESVITTDPTASSPTWMVSTIDGTNQLNAVTCPTSALCVAIDADGNALVSQNPAAASPTWTSQRIATGKHTKTLTQVSCVSSTFCIVIDGLGNEIISRDPTAAVPTWTTHPLNKLGNLYGGLSCPSSTLCVFAPSPVALVSTNPAVAPLSRWKVTTIDPQESSGEPNLTGVSCPSVSLCVAVDDTGIALTSADPAANKPRWSKTLVRPDFSGLSGVSCQSSTLCVAFGGGTVSVSTDPAAPNRVPGHRSGTYRGAIQGGGKITIKVAGSSVTAINVSHEPLTCKTGNDGGLGGTYWIRSTPGHPARISATGRFNGNHLKFASPNLDISSSRHGDYNGSGSVDGTVAGTTIIGFVDGGGGPGGLCDGGGFYLATLRG